MSLYKQLMLAIVVSSILALIGSIVTSTLSTRAYLIEQLRVKNQDNASALAVSLSQTADDAIKAQLAIAAQFDSGNYKLVRFEDPFGKLLLEKKALDMPGNVPNWFMYFLPIQVPSGYAKVSKGWTQLGSVTLESHSSYAYRSLWASSLRMSLIMTLAATLGCILGVLVLRRIKKPLDQVVDQARAITEKRFVTIPLPGVPELKQLASAMNLTVKRLKAIFAEEAERLEQVRREANFDQVTGLPNRNSFMTQLREALHTEETAFGACLIFRISHLAEINKNYGRVVTDNVIKTIGQIIEKYSNKMHHSLAGRLNGSDFALLVPSSQPKKIAENLMKDIIRATKKHTQFSEIGSIGMTQYHKGVTLADLLNQLDVALASAESQGKNAVVIADLEENPAFPKTIDAWAKLIKQAIKEKWMYLLSFPVGDFSGRILHREGPLRLLTAKNGEWIPAGKFFPIAERLRLNDALDLAAVELGLKEIQKQKKLPGFAINLSNESMRVKSFIPSLKKLLATYPKEAKKLWLEIPESGAFSFYNEFRGLCLSLKGTGIKLGIEHFGRRFDQINLLHDLGLDYLKVDASFIRDVEANLGNQSFLKGLVNMAHGIGMIVIAEGVLTVKEFNMLKKLGFDGATGPAVKE
jgi:diguanylate cyclase (GGDEF)-like protein